MVHTALAIGRDAIAEIVPTILDKLIQLIGQVNPISWTNVSNRLDKSVQKAGQTCPILFIILPTCGNERKFYELCICRCRIGCPPHVFSPTKVKPMRL